LDIIVYRYNIQWYMCSEQIQKSILLVLQRRTKDFHLTCGGLFVASLECFAMVKSGNMYFRIQTVKKKRNYKTKDNRYILQISLHLSFITARESVHVLFYFGIFCTMIKCKYIKKTDTNNLLKI